MGALLAANSHSRQATPSHTRPRITWSDDTPSLIWHHPATQRNRLTVKQVCRESVVGLADPRNIGGTAPSAGSSSRSPEPAPLSRRLAAPPVRPETGTSRTWPDPSLASAPHAHPVPLRHPFNLRPMLITLRQRCQLFVRSAAPKHGAAGYYSVPGNAAFPFRAAPAHSCAAVRTPAHWSLGLLHVLQAFGVTSSIRGVVRRNPLKDRS